MTENGYTEAQVLTAHGIAPANTDTAREHGLIWACLGCGSVGGINVEELRKQEFGPLTIESMRRMTRDNLDLDSPCCADSDQIIY